LLPNLEGLGNLQGLKNNCKAREPAWPSAGVKSHYPGSIAVGIAVGFPVGMAMPNQRTEKAHARTGLQPHSAMRLKPEELVCFIVTRQLKQTAIKQPAMKEKEIAMDSLYGSPNLEGLGNLQGLKNNCKAREPAGHPPEAVCRSGTPAEACCVHINIMVRVRDGTVVHIRDDTDLHIRNGTGLGIRNASVNRPVHTPEWERNAKKRVKCRMMNNEYRMMNEESGNVDSGSRRSEVGGRAEGIPTGEDRRRKTEDRSWKLEARSRNPKPGTCNPERGTRNVEPGTRNVEPGTRNPELGTRNSKP
jgi:hypothetical protein